MNILLVEDDEILGEGIVAGLQHRGFTVTWARDGLSAKAEIERDQARLLVLDLGLPQISGLDLLRGLRAEGSNMPVLILTARDATEDTIIGLDAGADDYLTKPFELEELFARIRSLIRRAQTSAASKFIYKNVCLYPASQTVTVDNKVVKVTRKEYALLHMLIENQGKVLTREELLKSVYGWSDDVDSNVLEVHIHSIRKKLLAPFIRTVRGIGYVADKDA